VRSDDYHNAMRRYLDGQAPRGRTAPRRGAWHDGEAIEKGRVTSQSSGSGGEIEALHHLTIQVTAYKRKAATDCLTGIGHYRPL
jgi:hypothetical protein